jgi:hypothetical protein
MDIKIHLESGLMASLWRYVPGTGWVLQPVPVSSGCVITAPKSRGFGFGRALRRALRRFLKRPFGVIAVVTSLGALVWMWLVGNHGHDVLLAVLAAVPAAVLDAAYKDIKSATRKRCGRKSYGSGGERAWR